MLIKSIEVENIRSYTGAKFQFNEGINFLAGDIGAGKSSILLAIEFALLGFNRTDLQGYNLLRRGKNNGSVKLNLLDEENNVNIEIYRKIKKSKSTDLINQETGYIKIDNDLEELAPTDLNSAIFNILNLPPEFLNRDRNLVYRFTVYTPQEQLKEILFSENEKRLDLIRKLFNIDKFKQIKNNSLLFLNHLKQDKKIFESKLENKEEIKTNIKKLEDENLDLKKMIEKVSPNLEKNKLSIQTNKDKLEKIDSSLKTLQEKEMIVRNNLAKINDLIEYQDKLKLKLKEYKDESELILKKNKDLDLSNLKKDSLELEDKIKKTVDEENKIKLELREEESLREKFDLEKLKENTLESKKKYLMDLKEKNDIVLTKCQIKDLDILIKKYKTNIEKFDEYSETLQELELKNSTLEINNSMLIESNEVEKTKLDEITKLTICPTCSQELDLEHRKKIDKQLDFTLKKNIEKIEKNKGLIIQNKKKIDKLKVLVSEINEKKDKYLEANEKSKFLHEKLKAELVDSDNISKLNDEINNLMNEIKNLKKEKLDEKISKINNSKKKLDLIYSKKEVLNTDLNKVNEKILNLINQNTRIEKLNSEIKEIEKQISENLIKINRKKEFEDKSKIIFNKKKEFEELAMKIKKQQEELIKEEKEIEVAMAQFKTKLEEKNIQITKLKAEIDKIKVFEDKLLQIKDYESLLGDKVVKICDLIEQTLFTKYYVEFNESFEKYFRELIEDNEIEVRLNEEFEIIVEQNGYDIEIKNLSGGEKSSLAVAYRLGIKKIIEDNADSRHNLNILILDEPTDGFSSDQIDRLGVILKESGIRQILLVSHDQKIEAISDYVINIEKQNHISFS